MRTILLSIFLLSQTVFFAQSAFHDKADNLLQHMDLQGLETGMLYDRTYPVSGLAEETYAAKNMNAAFFSQAYSELSESDYINRFQPIMGLKKEINKRSPQVSLGLLNVDIERVTKQAMIDGLVYLDVDGYVKRIAGSPSPFERKNVLIISPLQKIHDGLSVDFSINPLYHLETSEATATALWGDFGDGMKSIPMNSEMFHVDFNTAGTHEIIFQIQLSDGQLLRRNSSIEIREVQEEIDFDQANMRYPGQVTPVLTVNAKIAYQGYTETTAIKGRGQAKAYLDNVDGVFDKPIILMDGFDPGDSRSIEALYSLLDFGTGGENLADVVRDEGYDLVLLNFPTYTKKLVTIDGGADYIQRNAMVLVEAIKKINARKVGNEELVVIGTSMGGLIARYALRYMETHGMNHQTRLYVSFDSPHLGANIPIGAQYLVNYYGYEYGDQATQDLVNQALRSAAAKQMILDHVDGHLANNSNVEQNPNLKLPAGSPGFRDVFQAELDAMGFPVNSRNISLVNGSGVGLDIETANALALNTTFDIAFSVNADAKVRYTPAAGNTNTVCTLNGYILWFIPVFSFSAQSAAHAYTDGYDSAPGGTTDIATTISSFGDSGALIDPNDLLVDNFSFIPVYSSLAIAGPVNQHAAVNPADVTAFDAYYAPVENEGHVTLTEANVNFVLDEIRGVAVGVLHEEVSTLFELRSTWVSDALIADLIGKDFSSEMVAVRILSTTGQLLLQERFSASNPSLRINLTLTSGLYLIEVAKGERVEVKKFFVN